MTASIRNRVRFSAFSKTWPARRNASIGSAAGPAQSDDMSRDRQAPGVLDRITPVCVVLYAVWTVYVHVLSLAQQSFTTLLWLLPAANLAAVVAAFVWLRADRRASPRLIRANAGSEAGAWWRWRWPFAAFAVAWVALYSVTRDFTLFWWGSVAGLSIVCAAMFIGGGGGGQVRVANAPSSRDNLLLAGLCLAAVIVTLVANRPDIDDAFYLSIPTTLLRYPSQPILLHDTLYRLPNLPIEFFGYREHTYEVLIGVMSRLTGLAPITVAHLVLPPLFAVLAVLAWAWLVRMLAPKRWLGVLGMLFACMLLLGEAHHAYGNFGFVRIFQGKGIELSWSIPAIIACALAWMRNGRASDWLLLVASQVAAIGITSSGLFVAPLAAAFALAGGWEPGIASMRRLAVGLCASWYVVLVGAVLATNKVHGAEWAASAIGMASLGDIVVQTWGYWSALPLLAALLATWTACGDRGTAQVFAVMSLLFLLVCFNPYAYQLIARHVMGSSAFWRVSWAVPLPLMLAIVLQSSLAHALALPVRWRGWKWLSVATACLAMVWAGTQVGTLRAANNVTIGRPVIKVPPSDYRLARRLVDEMPESTMLLAPESVASWCSTFVRHPQLLSVRAMYLWGVAPQLGSDDVARRFTMQGYVSGWQRTPESMAVLRDGIDRYRLQTVVVAGTVPWRDEIGQVLAAAGFHAASDDGYIVWRRT